METILWVAEKRSLADAIIKVLPGAVEESRTFVKVSAQLKEALIAFHCATISENIADRRGARRRNRVNAAHGAW